MWYYVWMSFISSNNVPTNQICTIILIFFKRVIFLWASVNCWSNQYLCRMEHFKNPINEKKKKQKTDYMIIGPNIRPKNIFIGTEHRNDTAFFIWKNDDKLKMTSLSASTDFDEVYFWILIIVCFANK